VSRIVITLAGLMGASGVILAAVGAHVAPGTGLDSAAYILLFHAAAVLGGTAILHQGLLWRPLAAVVLAAWVLGSLFRRSRILEVGYWQVKVRGGSSLRGARGLAAGRAQPMLRHCGIRLRSGPFPRSASSDSAVTTS
jgi:hypothetical protein